MKLNTELQAKPRTYLPTDYRVSDWKDLKPYFENLLSKEIDDQVDFETWLQNLSELDAVIGEDICWRQIKMTCNTQDDKLTENFNYFITQIEPQIKPYIFNLNKKLVASKYINTLNKDIYFPYIRNVKNQIELYKEENITLQSEVAVLAQQYGTLSGAMSINHDDKQITLQQASKYLHDSNRSLRETVFKEISARRLQDKNAFNTLFDQLLSKRNQIAINAGYDNYRDYKFKELGRFDYTIQDCLNFHEAVKEHIVPLQEKILLLKKEKLNITILKPYDTLAVAANEIPLQPFKDGDDLIQKSIKVFNHLHPFFGSCLEKMKSVNRLDLDSRMGKAPGGYNCPLPETGIPFIFMNAAGTINDLITMMHEGGHAVHSFLSHDLPLSAMKEYPMEVAELASMSMELFTMAYWDEFFEDKEDCKRAQREELERVIDVLPWIAIIDKFQHWLYTNPNHTIEQRETQWLNIYNEFTPNIIDWSGFEDYQKSMWHKQLHLFEVPFYYIEYGIAQLGAIAMWRQYHQNKDTALQNYITALSAGYTQTLPELYNLAGISFDFSTNYIKELSLFVNEQLNLLNN